MTALASLCLCATLAIGADEKPEAETKAFNTRDLAIPIIIDPARRGEIDEIFLYVSRNAGKEWHVASHVTPDKDRFTYSAPADGTYWFAMRVFLKNGDTEPPPEDRLVPLKQVQIATTAKIPKQKAARPTKPTPGEDGSGKSSESADPEKEVRRLKERVRELEKRLEDAKRRETKDK